MRQVALPDGTHVPALGQGTWTMGERRERRSEEIAAIRAGVDHGLTVIDTAEMYGDGATEEFLAEALHGLRERVFIVSKALPQHASAATLASACEASLRRLGTDHLDLYLLHWRGSVPLGETVAGMRSLIEAGKILRWGVSNFDTDDLDDLWAAGGEDCATNQILFNLRRRGPEHDLLPWMDRAGVPTMAYSPVEQGRLAGHETLQAVARRHGVASLQVALAWVLRNDTVIAIPKAGTAAHVDENRRALDLVLDDDDLASLARAFPAPRRKVPLEML